MSPTLQRKAAGMDEEELEKLIARVVRAQSASRKSPWLAPTILLGIVVYVVPILFMGGKFSQRIDNLEAAQKAEISEKDADIQYQQLRSDIQALKDDNKELKAQVRSLEIAVGNSHGR